MNAKFTVRAIQQGQAQKTHTVTAGAGQNGQALVLQAAANTRYQLADMLTFTSPAKLQLKRTGKDLLVALPGNDVSTPDIVIRDYFEFDGMSLSGLAQNGEPMVYDTSSSFFSSIMPGSTPGVSAQSLTPNQTTAASLAKGSTGWFDSGWGLVALGAGGLALAAGGGGGGSTNASLSKITTYKSDATKAVPSVTDFAAAGVSGVDANNINAVLSYFPRTQLPLDSAGSLQSLVDSFKKILAEANGTSADATPDSDPLLADYVNLMGANTPNSIASKAQALALLNDRIKALNSTDVDTYTELKAQADAVETVAQLAQSTPSTTGTPASGITSAQLTSLGVDASNVTTANLAAYADAIRASADDLSTLNTTAKLTALVKAYNTILAEANGTATDATTANPTAADYAAIGADIGSAKTDAAALDRLNAIVGNLTTSGVDTVDEINKLAATLDKIQTVAALATGATLTDAQKFSVDELKNLGLTGFTGTDAQNTALALKVSEAIRDKNPADVIAGTFSKGKLDATTSQLIDWNQTQLERLQTLVSQEIIKNYVVDTANTANTTLAPTLTDWQNIGVFKPVTLKDTPANSAAQGYSALTATELAYLNSAADKLGASAISSQAQAQAVLEAYLRIVQEANGSATDANTSLNPTAADLGLVGVTGDAADGSKEASKLMLDVIANLSSTGVDTVAELQALASTTTKLMTEAAASTATGSFSLTELSNLGLRGASTTGASANLSDFLGHVRGTADTGTDINTLAELQGLLSLAVVQAWARDVDPDANASPAVAKTAATPTAQDYKDIGVVRSMPKNADGSAGTVPATMSPADLAAVNDAIDILVVAKTATTGEKIDTLQEVRDIATSYFKILNEANGSASNFISGHTVQVIDGVNSTAYVDDGASTSNVGSTGSSPLNYDLSPNPVAADYTRIGVDFSKFANFSTYTDSYTSLLNTLIAEKNFGQVDTVKEIQTLADTVDKVLALAAKDNALSSVLPADKLSLTQMQTDLGLTGVSSTNLDHILLTIQKQDVTAADSFAELQSWVSFTRVADYADDSNATTNPGGTPTAFDWHAIVGLTGELDANVSAYNSVVDRMSSTEISALSNLQGIVNAYNHIIAAADGNKLSVPATSNADLLADYGMVLGTTGSSAYAGLGTATSDVMKLMVNANSALGSGSVDTVGELSNIALAAGRVIALSNESTSVSTSATGQATVTNAAGVTKNDLTLLGLDTSKINNGSGTYDTYEFGNILAEIQNLNPPSQASDLATLQNKIDKWALS